MYTTLRWFNDPDGEFFNLVAGGFGGIIGGAWNVVSNLGAITSPWKALGYFGSGFAGGFVTGSTGNFVAGAAITGGLNALMGGGGLKEAIIGSATSAISAYVGGQVGNVLDKAIKPVLKQIKVPAGIIGLGIKTTLSRATVSVGMQTVNSVLNGEPLHIDFGDVVTSGIVGFATGAATGALQAHTEGRNLLTGRITHNRVIVGWLKGTFGEWASKSGIPKMTLTDASGFSADKRSMNVLSAGDALRIENATTRIGKPISVVGSRATGTAGAYSDWGYVIEGIKNSSWKKIKNSLPGSKSVLENTSRNIDIFKTLDLRRPHITIYPR